MPATDPTATDPGTPILHDRLPSAPWMVPAQRRLPGMQLLDMADWLTVDEAFGGQMALRD